MIEHDIYAGLSVTEKKKTTSLDAFSFADSIFDYLVSTGGIINFVIELSTKMLDNKLPNDYITIGKTISLTHNHATLIGETIELTVTVEEVENNRIFLDFVCKDCSGIICSGKYERIIIEKNRLNREAFERCEG